MNDFVFNYIFQNEKDKAWSNARLFRFYIRKKYNIVDVEFVSKLYAFINKYQVKKYGGSINPHSIRTKEDYLLRAQLVRQSRYERKK